MIASLLKDKQVVTGWTVDYPTEPGSIWWFYGGLWGSNTVKLIAVCVYQNGDGRVSYVADGAILAKSEMKGLWLKCVAPVPSDDEWLQFQCGI